MALTARYLLYKPDSLASEYKQHLEYFKGLKNPDLIDVMHLFEARVRLDTYEEIADDLTKIVFERKD